MRVGLLCQSQGEVNDVVALRDSLREAAILKARQNFYAYVQLIAPTILPEGFQDGRHIELIAEAIQKIDETPDARLMLFMPPRSMKSRLGSILGPSWHLGRHPTWDIMTVSYGKDLATDFSREVRNLVKSDEYLEIFPDMALRKDSTAAHRWHTSKGGVFSAGGITSGIAGKGAHIAIIDDPLSEQEAFSKASRAFVHRWYPGGLRSRLAPGGRIILITTRWHEDDLAGHLLKQMGDEDDMLDKWEVLDIPGIIDNQKTSVLLGHPIGSSYWPERWSTERMEKTRANTPPGQWSALYMQRPTPEDGGIFRIEDFQEWPHEKAPKCEYVVQSYDTAFSTKDTADFSAITTWGVFRLKEQDDKGREIDAPHMILLSAWRDRVDFKGLMDKGRELQKKYNPDKVIIEDKASGQSLIQEMRRGNVPIIAYKPERDKIARANAASVVLQNGRVWVRLNRRFTEEFLDECKAFPNAAHDDMVDTFTQAVLYIRDGWKLNLPQDWSWGATEDVKKKRGTYWTAVAA
jgi:predicted phage terminase large subunit-like protein